MLEILSILKTLMETFAPALITLALVLVTLALVVVTWMYARHTKRIADIMVKDYETRLAPLLDVVAGKASSNIDLYEQRLSIYNRGAYAASVRNVELIIYLRDSPDTYEKRTLKEESINLAPNSEPLQFPLIIRREEIANEDIRKFDNKFKGKF